MKAFDFVTAKDSNDAVALLAQHGRTSRILAGGTDLLPELKAGQHAPGLIVDISRAADLKGIMRTEGGLRIGALVTHAEIMRSPLIRDLCPALAAAAHAVGAVQTRNLGTIGGNLVTCVPSMDGGPTLLAFDARLTIAGPGGRREIALADLFVGPRKTVLTADELLVEILIPAENLGKPAAFQKFGLRKGQALALVNAAASFWVDRDAHTFVAPRIALGAVAPTVMRARQAEAFLEGRAISPAAMAEAGAIAAREAKPISDFRASADYRRDLTAVLTRRVLEQAYAQAKVQEGLR